MGREPKDTGHTASSCFVWPRHLQAPGGLPLALFVDVRPAYAALFQIAVAGKSQTRHLNNRTGCRKLLGRREENKTMKRDLSSLKSGMVKVMIEDLLW